MNAWKTAATLLLAAGLGLSGSRHARAEDVTLTVWTHEADEDAKVAFRELAAKQPRDGASRRCTSRSPGTRRTRCSLR